MRRVVPVLLACLAILFIGIQPADAQQNQRPRWRWPKPTQPAKPSNDPCAATPEAALSCFLKNGTAAGLFRIPEGMTEEQFRDYGLSVARIVRSPDTVVFLLGSMAAVADALPPVNADGVTPNAAAQDQAIKSILEAAARAGLLSLPQNTNTDQLAAFAGDLAGAMADYRGATLSPGMPLRLLDSILISSAGATGQVDRELAQTKIAQLVDGLLAAGVLALPPNVTADAMKQFGFAVADALQQYKQATGTARLAPPLVARN